MNSVTLTIAIGISPGDLKEKMMKQIFKTMLLVSIAGIVTSCCQPDGKTDKQETKKSTEMKQTAVNTLSQAEIDDGWVLLFDGKSTDHWRGYNKESFPQKGWVVENGTLKVLSSGKGEAGGGGDIITKEEYDNFEFSLEWKVSEGGNSGVFYLAQEKPDQPISLYDLIPGNMDVVNPAGEWNKVKILVYKGTVVHWVNGEQVLEYHLWTEDWKNMIMQSKFKDYDDFLNTAEKGYIGLQDHGDDVWFRNIKIKVL